MDPTISFSPTAPATPVASNGIEPTAEAEAPAAFYDGDGDASAALPESALPYAVTTLMSAVRLLTKKRYFCTEKILHAQWKLRGATDAAQRQAVLTRALKQLRLFKSASGFALPMK